MKRILLIFAFAGGLITTTLAQTPYISSFSPEKAGVFEEVTIVGNGFSSNKADLMVHFGAVKANKISYASENLIIVKVPAGISTALLKVTNTASGKVAYSNESFFLTYQGTPDIDNSFFEHTDKELIESGISDMNIADLDVDGKTDLLFANRQSLPQRVNILGNNSDFDDYSFQQQTLNSNNSFTNFATSADLNADGLPEMIFSKYIQGGNEIIIFENTSTPGNISFTLLPAIQIPDERNHQLQQIEVNDLDKDGYPEIIVADRQASSSSPKNIYIFENNANGTISFNSTPIIASISGQGLTTGFNEIQIADINQDGFPEIISNLFENPFIYIFQNLSSPGEISISDDPYQLNVNNSNRPHNIRVADLNADFRPDIITTNLRQGDNRQVSVMLNASTTGNIAFEDELALNTGSILIEDLDVGDINGDGLLDLVLGSALNNANQSVIKVMLNTSSAGNFSLTEGTDIIEIQSKNNTRIIDIKCVDINVDGKTDILYLPDNHDGFYTLLNRNCISPTLEPNADDVKLCGTQPAEFSTTQAIGVDYQWFINKDGAGSTAIPGATDSTLFYAADSLGTNNVFFAAMETYTGSTGNTCTESTSTVTVERDGGASVLSKPTISPVSAQCFGDSVTLTSSNISGADVYIWRFPDGTRDTISSPTLTIAARNAGEHYVKGRNTTTECESDSSEIILDVISLPKLSITTSRTTLCEDDTFALKVPRFDNYTYSWYLDSNAITDADTANIRVPETGEVVASIGDGSCTNFSDTLQLQKVAYPEPAIVSADSICFDASISFSGVNSDTFNMPSTFQWRFGNDATAQGIEASTSYANAGSFDAELLVYYNELSHCRDSVTQTIQVVSPPDINIVSTNESLSFCRDTSISLSLDSDLDSLQWSTGNTSPTITVNTEGQWSIAAFAPYSCIARDTVTTTFLPQPEINVSTSLDNATAGPEESFQLMASADSTSSWLWGPSSLLNDPAVAEPVVEKITQTTTFTVSGTNDFGCKDSTEIQIFFNLPDQLAIPKFFSPNGDGVNQDFVIPGLDLINETNELIVFDERGRMIYQASPYQNDWDGTVNGRVLPDGVYYYILKRPNSTQKGSVTIIK